MRRFVSRVLAAVWSREHEREIDDDMASHLAEATDEYIAPGLSRDEAWRAAARDFWRDGPGEAAPPRGSNVHVAE
jgi:hypothetical protein